MCVFCVLLKCAYKGGSCEFSECGVHVVVYLRWPIKGSKRVFHEVCNVTLKGRCMCGNWLFPS